jgi:hypothetical protein
MYQATLFRPLLDHHQADVRTLKVSYKIWLFMPDGIPCGLQFLYRPDDVPVRDETA